MPKKSISAHLLPVLLSFALTACATVQQATVPKYEDLWIGAKGTGVDPKQTAEYNILAGELAAGRNLPGVAAKHFLDALSVVEDPRLAARATALALAADDQKLGIRIAQRWRELAPDDGTPSELLVRLNLREGLTAAALAEARNLALGDAAGLDEGLRSVALLLSQEAEHGERALKVMQELVAPYSDNAAAHYALGLLAIRFKKSELALQAADRALQLEPASLDMALLRIGALLQLARFDDADQDFARLLRQSDAPAALHLGYAKLLVDADQVARATTQFEAILALQPDSAEALHTLGLLQLQQSNLDAAEQHFLALYEQQQHRSDAAYYLGRIAQARREIEPALDWYAKVNSGNQVVDAAVRRANLLAQSGDLLQARYLLLQLRRQFPRMQMQLILTEADLLSRAGAHDDALQLFERALEAYPDEDDLIYGRALVYEQMGDLARAESELRELIKANPDDARALNALGYMLVVHHQDRTQDALELVERALALTPDDAAVIDSMGWIQFRLGRVQQARQYLTKAFEKLEDPEIAAHLGEVLWTLGERDQARTIWQQALQDNPDHKVLRDTVERLMQ